MTDRNRLIELITKEVARPKADALADYLLANGVIVPPCKVGQTIYRIGNGKIWEWDITVIEVYPDEIALVDDGDNYIKPSEIGKTVFLTKEEAEEKLRERKEDEGK